MPKVRDLLRRYFDEYVAALIELLGQGNARGEFSVAHPRDVALNLVSLIEGASLLWVFDIEHFDLDRQFQAAVSLLLNTPSPHTDAGS